MKKPTRGDLLEHYAYKTPRAFVQYDGFAHTEEEITMRPDKDGDSLHSGLTYELMTGIPDVRVLITPRTPPGDVMRLLKKIRKWIKQDGMDSEMIAELKKAEAEDDVPF